MEEEEEEEVDLERARQDFIPCKGYSVSDQG